MDQLAALSARPRRVDERAAQITRQNPPPPAFPVSGQYASPHHSRLRVAISSTPKAQHLFVWEHSSNVRHCNFENPIAQRSIMIVYAPRRLRSVHAHYRIVICTLATSFASSASPIFHLTTRWRSPLSDLTTNCSPALSRRSAPYASVRSLLQCSQFRP